MLTTAILLVPALVEEELDERQPLRVVDAVVAEVAGVAKEAKAERGSDCPRR